MDQWNKREHKQQARIIWINERRVRTIGHTQKNDDYKIKYVEANAIKTILRRAQYNNIEEKGKNWYFSEKLRLNLIICNRTTYINHIKSDIKQTMLRIFIQILFHSTYSSCPHFQSLIAFVVAHRHLDMVQRPRTK